MSVLRQALLTHTTILDRYIVQQFTGPFLLSVGGFVIIGIVDILFTLVDLFINSGVPFLIVTRLLLYKVPAIMVLFFPMAVLFSVMLLLVRMAKDNEITILRCSGLNAFRILAPILVLCFITAYFSYFTNEKIVPWANRVSDNLIPKTIQKKAPPTIANNVFFKEEGDRFFYINKVDSKAGQMDDILIFERTEHYPRITTAKRAYWNEKTWTMHMGMIQEFNKDGQLDFVSKFDTTQIHVDRPVQSFYTTQKTAKEMDSTELKEKISALNKSGIGTRGLTVEYHLKKSIPFACFVFGIIGAAFCLRFVKTGKDWWGVVTAIISVVLLVGFYFFLVALCRSMGKKGTLIPLLSAWLPNIIYGLPGIGLITYECNYK